MLGLGCLGLKDVDLVWSLKISLGKTDLSELALVRWWTTISDTHVPGMVFTVHLKTFIESIKFIVYRKFLFIFIFFKDI